MANSSRLNDADSVLRACKDFDELGRQGFLKKYKFGKSDTYYLELNGRYYDSKAIVGVAFAYQYPNEGVLSSKDFHGGLGDSVKVLRKMNFTVIEGRPHFLVLAQNEISANPEFGWKDVTGERYHFPNAYKNRMRPGSKFIYYRGSRRKNGRSAPEYFGYGTLGDVYLDPETEGLPASQRAWFAEIEEYSEFVEPVVFRNSERMFLETGTSTINNNYWGNGVREIDQENFEVILRTANVPAPAKRVSGNVVRAIGQITPINSEGLLIQRIKKQKGRPTGGSSNVRRSARSKAIGDHAEQVVCEWLRSKIPEDKSENIVWVAARGETPGYDIEDRSNKKAVVGYEVKATNGRRFPNIEITANELQAARDMGDRYALVLVALAESEAPLIEFIKNPAVLIDTGSMSIEPTIYKLSLT